MEEIELSALLAGISKTLVRTVARLFVSTVLTQFGDLFEGQEATDWARMDRSGVVGEFDAENFVPKSFYKRGEYEFLEDGLRGHQVVKILGTNKVIEIDSNGRMVGYASNYLDGSKILSSSISKGVVLDKKVVGSTDGGTSFGSNAYSGVESEIEKSLKKLMLESFSQWLNMMSKTVTLEKEILPENYNSMTPEQQQQFWKVYNEYRAGQKPSYSRSSNRY